MNLDYLALIHDTGTSEARKFLASFRASKLEWPPKTELVRHVPNPSQGSARARISQELKAQPSTSKSNKIGLGLVLGGPGPRPLMSYIGDDKNYL